jgi:restriction endonuclease Mrr
VEASNLSRRRAKASNNSAVGVVVVLVVVLVIPIVLLNAALVGLGLPAQSNVTAGIAVFIYLIVVIVVVLVWVRAAVIKKRKAEEEQKQREEERLRQLDEQNARARQQKEARRKRLAQQEEARRREEQERAEQIEALLARDEFRDSVHYMSGVEFENFMANVFDKKGYHVQITPHQDQGVDLLLTIDDRQVAVQLKRYTGPVGNAAIQAVVAGMFHYRAKEAWVITTSSFTKNAVELAKSNRVRLIDGRELEDWLVDLRDEA